MAWCLFWVGCGIGLVRGGVCQRVAGIGSCFWGKGEGGRGLRVNFQLYVFGCYMPWQCECGPWNWFICTDATKGRHVPCVDTVFWFDGLLLDGYLKHCLISLQEKPHVEWLAPTCALKKIGNLFAKCEILVSFCGKREAPCACLGHKGNKAKDGNGGGLQMGPKGLLWGPSQAQKRGRDAASDSLLGAHGKASKAWVPSLGLMPSSVVHLTLHTLLQKN